VDGCLAGSAPDWVNAAPDPAGASTAAAARAGAAGVARLAVAVTGAASTSLTMSASNTYRRELFWLQPARR
jgi:hypothetical protein